MCPWKLYGLVRGLNAPPRRPVAPRALSFRRQGDDLLLALDRTGAGDHRDPLAADLEAAGLDDGPLGLQLRDEARLYGAMIGRTFSTPSPGSSASVSPGRSSPIAAITVWCVPLITWGVSPSEVMC